MANASVDKLKALGIRHGEKAVVGLAAALFVVFTALAIIRPTLEMKPEQLSTAASNADANLRKQQAEPDILAKLQSDGMVDPHFVDLVDNQIKNALKPDGYRTKLDWVTPEPGAGLIRDQPELIAPTELAAFPGRGGILMYSLNEKGERIILVGDEAKKKGGRNGGRPGAMGGPGGGRAPREEKPEDKKRREAAEERQKKQFAGQVDEKEKEKAKEGDQPDAAPEGPWKEEPRGKRWVVLTGVIDNDQLKKNYLLALKNPSVAYPNYKRVDVERRSQDSDGSWSEWTATDQNKNYEVLDNLPELETEYVPASQRPAALVDPLPFLRAGYWTGVHVARLVPRDILEAPKTKTAGGGMAGVMGPGGDESRMGPGGGQASVSSGGGGKGNVMGGGGRSMGVMGEGGTAAAGPGPGGDLDDSNFTKLDEKTLMLRSFDFTVDPDTTYQFRVRIVVVNPNLNHTDVNPGVDVDSKELLGPWSDPTDSVSVPADVAAYAQAPEPASRRDDLVSFQVIKWDTGTGQTLVKTDIAGPGEIIGEYGTIPMPSSEGGGPKPASIDFNSRAIVLDTIGGRQKLPDIGVERNPFEVPAVAMVVEPDGSVVIRSQAIDKPDDVRQDMEEGYKQAIIDSGSPRHSGSGSRMPGAAKKKKKKRR